MLALLVLVVPERRATRLFFGGFGHNFSALLFSHSVGVCQPPPCLEEMCAKVIPIVLCSSCYFCNVGDIII